MKRNAKNPNHTVMANIIRAAGARATSARMRVFSLLMSASFPLSHAEIEAMLAKERQPKIDRVTLYRVLDWLTEVGFAYKASDASGVFRYASSTPDVDHAEHTHFRCTTCSGIYCLKAPMPRTPPLPKGFHLTKMNLDLQGKCSRCSTSHK